MPTISHAETNALSRNKYPNVHIPDAFNNNVVTEGGAINSASGCVRRE